MAIKTYKPTTPSRRNMTVTDYSGLSKVKPAATATAESPFATEAAETAENIVSSISNAARTA